MSQNQYLDISKRDKLGRESCMSHNIKPGFCQFRPDQRVPVVMVHAIQPAGHSVLSTLVLVYWQNVKDYNGFGRMKHRNKMKTKHVSYSWFYC